MRAIAVFGYFIAPAIVFFTIGIGSSGIRGLDSVSVQYFLPNYLIFAAPQILWGILTLALRLSPAVSHAGYIAATVALLSLHLFFECCANNANAIGWLYYWPLAAVLAPSFAALVATRKPSINDAPNT